MQFIKFAATAVAAILSFATVSEAASCLRRAHAFYRTFVIIANGVDNVQALCNGFRDNQDNTCPGFPPQSNRDVPSETGGKCHLQWEFNLPTTYFSDHVEGGWWAATHTKFGTINCVDIFDKRSHARDLSMN